LIKLEFYRKIFEKYSNVKFHENPSIGSGFVPCGRADRQTNDEAIIRLLQFCERAYKVQNNMVINTLDIKSVTRRRAVM